MIFKITFVLYIVIMLMPLTSAAHFIAGIINDARDGTQSNDKTIVLWNSANGVDDNLTDIIGPNGNSNSDNIYLIDCELLNTSCDVGDILTLQVINKDDYITGMINVTVTGAGFDVVENLTLNSPPSINAIIVEDSILSPENEIDLIAGSNRTVTCNATVDELDGDSLQNANAQFFHTTSFYGDSDDNNYHYTNTSCFVNTSYGGQNESEIVCDFNVRYYANPNSWSCVITVEDNSSISSNSSDSTSINTLLAIGVPDTISYGLVNATEVSLENVTNVTNLGNVRINLSLYGYSHSEGDNFSMNCSLGANISMENEKYNLSASNPGTLNLTEFEINYTSLTNNSVIRKFDLYYRQNDVENEAKNQTYWRIHVPKGVGGTCQGNIVFGATQGAES